MFAIFLVYAVRQLDLSAGTIGLVFAIGNVGYLVGAITTNRIAGKVGVGPAIVARRRRRHRRTARPARTRERAYSVPHRVPASSSASVAALQHHAGQLPPGDHARAAPGPDELGDALHRLGRHPARDAHRWCDRVGAGSPRRDLGRGDRHVARLPASTALAGAHAPRDARARGGSSGGGTRARAVGCFRDRCRPSRTSLKERSPLLQRSIFALLSSEVISSLGSQMTFLALPWFVLTTTGSTTRMGIVLAAELLPIALLGIPSGAVVSRLGARADDARLGRSPACR